MPSQSEFELSGRIVWDEVERPPTDMFHMQAAMFKDRPDLWPMKRRPAHRTVKIGEGQLPLMEYKPERLRGCTVAVKTEGIEAPPLDSEVRK